MKLALHLPILHGSYLTELITIMPRSQSFSLQPHLCIDRCALDPLSSINNTVICGVFAFYQNGGGSQPYKACHVGLC